LSDADVLLFLHGYNVTCHEAVLRTAQIKYDLQFPGKAICYSWPSVGRINGYLTDANNAQWSVPHVAALLDRLRAPGREAHIVAHSMGNRVLLAALRDLPQRKGPRCFGQIMMAAPDVDADVFKELIKGVDANVTRMTLYASSNDEALWWSSKLQGGYTRAGQTRPNVVCADGVDTIDASEVATGLIQHSYYGDNRSVISDMHALLQSNQHPRDRFGMRELTLGTFTYWAFRP
jgi:esterase/lipase superfamily enzyme